MRRPFAIGVLSLALVTGGAMAGATIATKDPSDVSGKQPRSFAAHHAPQDFVFEDGVSRVWGDNRYETATAVSTEYGWDETNTVSVYIASGQDYPDALSVGPSTFLDGPLLLVTQGAIPSATRTELARLKPCFIHVVGGTTAVADSVYQDLKDYADPVLCQEQ